jgi:predicted nucleic acid-binding protein
VILVDTSIWIDHLRVTQQDLVDLLEQGQVVTHPFVIGELALGSIAGRAEFLGFLHDLPALGVVSHDEFMTFVDGRELSGRGIGLVDGHILASALIAPGTRLWSRDRRLASAAQALGVSADWL